MMCCHKKSRGVLRLLAERASIEFIQLHIKYIFNNQ